MPDTLNIAPAPAANELDSLALDSIAPIPEGEVPSALIFTAEPETTNSLNEGVADTASAGSGMSWIYVILAVLFCITALRFKGSIRYIQALTADLVDTRVRNNVFDDTVKETSLIVLLNVMWVACAGILCWLAVSHFISGPDHYSLNVTIKQPVGIALCGAIALGYLLIMMLAYWIVGNVFSDSRLASIWIKGAAASTGLQTFLLFPIALVALNYQSWVGPLLIVALIVFVAGKIIFLYKGFRIFFAQISSWLLFLYYLCSLEIIPVILTFAAMVAVCSS